MSFDIFTSERVWPSIAEYMSETWLIYVIMFLMFSVALIVASYIEYYYDGGKNKGILMSRIATSLGVSMVLMAAFCGLMYGLSSKAVVTNVDDVKAAIQQEYNIELTDESIENLYDTRGNRYKEHQYVADVDGQVHPYTVVGDSFYFIDAASVTK